MLFTMYFLKEQAAWTKGIVLIQPSLSDKLGNLISKTAMNYAIGVCSCVVTLSALGIYHEYQKPNNAIQTAFPTVLIDTYTINNEQDAYYLLRNYAYDDKALQVISDRLIIEMKPLYEALKECDGSFYHVLKTSGWTDSYEQRLKNF